MTELNENWKIELIENWNGKLIKKRIKTNISE